MADQQPPEMEAVKEITLRQLNPGLADAMQTLTEVDIPSIQENEFLAKWLPLFSDLTPAEKETLEDQSTLRPMMLWGQNVAKNPLSPVNVFDGETFLYQVPPLFGTLKFDFRERFPNYDIAHELAIADKKRSILPALGEAHIQDRVTKIVLPNFALNEEAAIQWNVIFARYGMPLIKLSTDAAAKLAEAIPASNELSASDVGDEPLDEL